MSFPVPDMSKWSILDFELAMDGIRQVNNACIGLQNQPRSSAPDYSYYPGATFIVELGEDWCSEIMSAITDCLAEIRFNDPEDEDRRLCLLLNYHCGWGSAGEPLADVLAMIEKWRAPNGVARADK